MRFPKFDLLFFVDNTMHFICYDLIRNIIEWVPRADLKYLSKASPVFDREINEAGIKIVYLDNSRKYIEIHAGQIVIKANSGTISIIVRHGLDGYMLLDHSSVPVRTVREFCGIRPYIFLVDKRHVPKIEYIDMGNSIIGYFDSDIKRMVTENFSVIFDGTTWIPFSKKK